MEARQDERQGLGLDFFGHSEKERLCNTIWRAEHIYKVGVLYYVSFSPSFVDNYQVYA